MGSSKSRGKTINLKSLMHKNPQNTSRSYALFANTQSVGHRFKDPK